MLDLMVDFLGNNLDGVVVAALAGALLTCVAMRYLRLTTWPLNDLAYFAICVALTVIYGLTFFPIIVIAWLLVPQFFFFVFMAVRIGVRKWRATSFRAPSLWWLSLVVVAGHAWTRFWLNAWASQVHLPR
jgi:hypothetical protein